MPLPVLIGDFNNVNDLISALTNGYKEFYNKYPESEEVSIWRKLGSQFMAEFKNYTILAECPIISLERADYLAIDKDKALVIEAKGWKNMESIFTSIYN